MVAQHGRPTGMLILFRPRQHKPFNNREQCLCAQLTPYLAHALENNSQDINYGEPGLPGMMVMSVQGEILYLTGEAKELLALACYPELSSDARQQEAEFFAKLAQVCRNLNAIAEGKHVAPPSLTHTNGRGRFTCRASWLDKLNQEQGRVIAVTIQHQEPLNLKILRALQDIPLSPVQKQVALQVAQGCSNEQIGQHLHIRLSTVKEHVGKIFDKLGIDKREALLPLLLEMASPSALTRH